MTARVASRLALLLLALRLLTWAFLLSPWCGFDEPFHHGYVEVCAETPGWYRFASVSVPSRLAEGMRPWPTDENYARTFGARLFGSESPLPPRASPVPNYETLQSPLYYQFGGLLLRLLPAMSPIGELFVLRSANGVLALAVGFLLLFSARRIGFGQDAWLPVAYLAFTPGFGLALVRVSNDALCAVLISLSIALNVRPRDRLDRAQLAGLAAGGISPWAKLYGWAAVPGLLPGALRKGSGGRRAAALLLLLGPGLLLAALSARKQGSPISLLEILGRHSPTSPFSVPWLRDLSTVVKSHLWISGMSDIVFPTPLYVVLAAALALLAVSTIRQYWNSPAPDERETLQFLLVPLFFFSLALAYFCWMNFAFYQRPGGAGGWYLWAMAVPEALILTWGAVGRSAGRTSVRVLLWALWFLTAAGDFVLFSEVSGKPRLTPVNHHLRGLEKTSLSELLRWFLGSRPRGIAVAAICLALASWALGAVLLALPGRRAASRQ